MNPCIDEEGSIEAGMVLIPTTAFFLLVLQLVVAGSFKTIETVNLQSWLNRSSLYAIDGSAAEQESLSDSEKQFSANTERQLRRVEEIDLPGGAKLYLAEARTKIPVISGFASKLATSNPLSVRSEALAIRE